MTTHREPFRCEPFAQDVAFVIEHSPPLTDHVERRLASMYDISATDSGEELHDRKRSRQPRPATHVKMFPGAIVCSLLRRNIPDLVDPRNNYVALEKTDGVRYLLLLTTLHGMPYAILIDRKMEMRIVNLDLPLALFEQEVLFDGELAQNVGNGLYTYLIFDLIYTRAVNERNERLRQDTPYTYRMRRAKELIQGQWNKQLTTEAEYNVYGSRNDGPPRPKNTFSLKVKRYVAVNDFAQTFADVYQRNLWTYHDFRIDGFIFVRSRQTVEPFRNTRQYKFKPADRHTIDLQLLEIGATKTFELLAKNARNCPERYALLVLCDKNKEFLAQHATMIQQCHASKQNFIVECSWDATQRCWLLQQPRVDKQTPNALHTIEQTKCNIDENITLAELIQAFANALPATSTTSSNRATTSVTAAPMVTASAAPTIGIGTSTTAVATPTVAAVPAAKGPIIHPSRLRNFQPMAAGAYPLPCIYSNDPLDDGCLCSFCTEKRCANEEKSDDEEESDDEAYDPEKNWNLREEPAAKRMATATSDALTSASQTLFFSDADLEELLKMARDPAVLQEISHAAVE